MHFVRTILFMCFALGLTMGPTLAQTEPIPAVNQPESTKAADSTEVEQVKAGMMKLTLTDDLELQGNPIELEAVKMNSLFGEANIPLHTIAGIRFAQQAGEQTTVVLLNGDALTGEIALTDIKFVSAWGEAKVNVSHLISIVFRPDFAWSSVQTPNGPRWRLTKVENPSNLPPSSAPYGRRYPPSTR